jgi:8-oxo-dGTP diphosphatase
MDKVKVGVAAIIERDGKILMGQRKNSHGAGRWSFPGGHIEPGETPEQACEREAMEETGLRLLNIRRGPWTNDIFLAEKKHYITLFLFADAEGTPALREPDKCAKWLWVEKDNIPFPQFLPVFNLMKEHPDILGKQPDGVSDDAGVPVEIQRGLQSNADKLDAMGGTCPECQITADMFRYLPVANYFNLGTRCTGTCKTCGIGPWEEIL